MKTNLDKFFKMDEKLEQDGVDFEISEGTSFRVRRFSGQNPKVKEAMAKYYKPHRKQIEMKTLDDKIANDIQINLFIDVCLVGWKGVEVDGQPLEFKKENAVKLFKSLPILFQTLWDHASDFENYKEELGN